MFLSSPLSGQAWTTWLRLCGAPWRMAAAAAQAAWHLMTTDRGPVRSAPAVALAFLLLGPVSASAEPAIIELDIVGGLAAVSQYQRHEEPFWSKRVPEITGGWVRARVVPFDRSGVRGREMLNFLRLGIVPFGTILLPLAAADEPELDAIDLPLLSPDIATLRRTLALWRPRLEALLLERFDSRLLAVYTHPPQVVFCREPFTSLADLAGRRVRTSAVGQSELVKALGGVPVLIPFSEMVAAIRAGIVTCAITGAASGNAVGLHEVTSHVSRLGIGWGVGIFAANRAAWDALPQEIQRQLKGGLAELEQQIWDDAAREAENGLNCNAGRPGCTGGRPGRMAIVEEPWRDDARRIRLLREAVIPNWVRRCGQDCANAWNRFMAPELGIAAEAAR